MVANGREGTGEGAFGKHVLAPNACRKSQKARITMRAFTPFIKAFATSALAAAAIAGGAGYAVAQDVSENPAPADAQSAAPQPGEAHQHGDHGEHAAALAAKLGVSEQQLQDAMKTIHSQHDKDGAQPGAPADQAQELADALGKNVNDVRTALDELRTEAEHAKRDELANRLDEAVKAGMLTTADKDSILKGFDAGVLTPPHSGHDVPQGAPQDAQPSQQG